MPDGTEGEGGQSTGIDTSSQEFKQAAEKYMEKTGLHKAMESEREARKELEKRLSRYEEIDPDEYNDLKAEKQKAEEERARAEGDFEKLIEQERQKFNRELEKRDERMKSLQNSLEQTLIESAAKSAIAQYEGDVDLLLPHVERRTKLMEVNGQHRAVVLGEDGEPMLAPDAKQATDYMGIEHLVGDWKENGKYAGAFAGTGASGGGAPASTRTGGAGAPRRITLEQAAQMDPTEYSKQVRSGELQVVDEA